MSEVISLELVVISPSAVVTRVSRPVTALALPVTPPSAVVSLVSSEVISLARAESAVDLAVCSPWMALVFPPTLEVNVVID